MEKYLLNPKTPNAFTSNVMHKVVLNGIDFDLPEHIWDAIDDAFGYYWNVEVGYGGWPDLYSAVNSISNWLQKEHIIFPTDKITTIVNLMFDWIEQIPGAILDDNDVVIPHSFKEDEEERQYLKKLEKELNQQEEERNQQEGKQEQPNSDSFTLPIHHFNDVCTNFVYISDKLKEFYPETYKRLTKLFDKMEIAWGEVNGTKDVWIRDYMPIQISNDRYLFYKYDPDYLKEYGEKFLTDAHAVSKGVLHHYHWRDIGVILDGGNVVPVGDYRVMTEKVFKENGKEPYDPDFCKLLKDVLYSDLIFLPWNCDEPKTPNADIYGHADGIIRWTGNNQVLMSNHRDFKPEEADEIRSRLEKAGYQVTEMLFDVPTPNKDFNWAYINYLQVGCRIIVPTFGIPEDRQALEYIRDANPYCLVKGFRMRDIARNGGALHCITWNIMK